MILGNFLYTWGRTLKIFLAILLSLGVAGLSQGCSRAPPGPFYVNKLPINRKAAILYKKPYKKAGFLDIRYKKLYKNIEKFRFLIFWEKMFFFFFVIFGRFSIIFDILDLGILIFIFKRWILLQREIHEAFFGPKFQFSVFRKFARTLCEWL